MLGSWEAKITDKFDISRPADSGRPTLEREPSRHPIGEDIYNALFADLIALRIPPGERLSVDALARHFGVSQTPIRAALIRLETGGLVTQKFNSGFTVAQLPDGKHFRDVYQTRDLLEPEMAALAAIKATTADFEAIEDLCNEMSRLSEVISEENFGHFAKCDHAFHTSITKIAGNQVITEALDRLYIHVNLFRIRYHKTITTQAVAEHRAILEALRAKDAVLARDSMRAHIYNSRQRVEPFFDQI